MVCVGVQASVHSPPIKLVWIVFPVVYNHRFRHVLIVDPCLRKHISLQPCVSNTSGLCPVSVFKHLSSAPVIKHVWFGAPCCVQVSISIRASTHFVVPGLCASSVYSPFVSNTFDLGNLVAYKCLSPSVLQHFLWFLVCAHHRSTALCLKHV